MAREPIWAYTDNYCIECGANRDESPKDFSAGWHDSEGGLYCDWCVAEEWKKHLEKTGESSLTMVVMIR